MESGLGRLRNSVRILQECVPLTVIKRRKENNAPSPPPLSALYTGLMNYSEKEEALAMVAWDIYSLRGVFFEDEDLVSLLSYALIEIEEAIKIATSRHMDEQKTEEI